MNSDPSRDTSGREWWRDAVVYNIYPRSWRDTNGDGHGDLSGVVERLDHLAWLGVDAIWLNPIMPSPNRDWGYDIADYTAVHPDLGTLADLDLLVEAAGQRRIRLVLDLVPSHTSDEHPWFRAARSDRGSPFREYYVWRTPGTDGAPPNNWLGYFGQPAWTLDERTGEYYLHTFLPQQPKLNWWSSRVAEEFERILRFWFDRGISGMRIDALQTLVHDRTLRPNPAAGDRDTPLERRLGQRFLRSGAQPETHGFIRGWRRIADSYTPPRLLFGETWVPSVDDLAPYYGDGSDELGLAWNLPFLGCDFTARSLRAVVERTVAALPPSAWPAWAMSTHDGEGRAATRWCHGDPAAARCALLLLLTLRGTPILYYGDEIGMTDAVDTPGSGRRDTAETAAPRDRSRTPMQWAPGPGAGFTSSPRPWLPVPGADAPTVVEQRAAPGSVLSFCRDLITIRRRHHELVSGAMRFVPAPEGVLAWERGDGDFLAVVNLGPAPAVVTRDTADGEVLIGTDRHRDHQTLTDQVSLAPYEGLLIRLTRRPAADSDRSRESGRAS
ncbi:alpha-amylase family glycosyl hydrolase [Pseudofrankia sp. BMG5.37]|uniref:alpha-amylase family glycosyl hydrolase n=1 Tax=Pseudofrankia sp. BMG5.37 TaxID=3050035 RepID=UPI00289467A6|nr:alpha-amylase family glycosyl hydrolase [Pseudofrankia sp. BMG5.37]MDT3446230.1 alpha-amylase family glycosyl hydrolase [Pseudofrankia sp. BMG5.37]